MWGKGGGAADPDKLQEIGATHYCGKRLVQCCLEDSEVCSGGSTPLGVWELELRGKSMQQGGTWAQSMRQLCLGEQSGLPWAFLNNTSTRAGKRAWEGRRRLESWWPATVPP